MLVVHTGRQSCHSLSFFSPTSDLLRRGTCPKLSLSSSCSVPIHSLASRLRERWRGAGSVRGSMFSSAPNLIKDSNNNKKTQNVY